MTEKKLAVFVALLYEYEKENLNEAGELSKEEQNAIIVLKNKAFIRLLRKKKK